MTSRPPVQQRSLSNNNVLQRPPQHRSVSQQFHSSSPSRRNNESFVDLTFEGSDGTQSRFGSASKTGGSRLKLEITKDPKSSSLTESPKPILDAPPPWKPSAPLRGRPQLHTDVSSNPSSSAAQDGHNEILPVRPMPMPVRPGQHPPLNVDKFRVASGSVVKKDARPKPYTLEVPAAAPHYAPNGHADFFPWMGNHPEDQFSESVIRQGFFDKSQMTQNETGSAKASIFPALKHKSGLQTLSSLFTGVLAQRRSYGQITSSSTFKPPPRVTVTDTKREMWLKDLANPTISLRRLSRSIPHGIRGKVLLDQSLSKNIPIERAVWLAKCVGANELRSFRRKGVSGTFAMGGEAKWIRDFTVCVEQFVESIVGSCGEKDFKNRISYAIRLSTHFHAEYLLDREHFMDWLVSALENSPQAKLPMWLLITQIYWKDLLMYRKYGRRLSCAILGHFAEAVLHQDSDILAPLVDRLRVLLRGLMISNPEGFICPKIWAKHCANIQSNLEPEDHEFLSAFTAIDRRNNRLTAPGMEKEPTARQQLIQKLDTLLWTPFTNNISKLYWHSSNDKAMLIRTVLEWSTSSYRPGVAKIFIGARVLRSWSNFEVVITENVLEFVVSKACEAGRSNTALYHLISELARSDHFSTPSYLQWLIARGGIYDAADVIRTGPCATRLLAELPTHNLSDGINSLRRTLLHRANFDIDKEEKETRTCIVLMNKTFQMVKADSDVEMQDQIKASTLSDHISTLSRTTKSELGLWLRQKVRTQMQSTVSASDEWDTLPMKGEITGITVSDFSTVRQYLELIDDYSMLADVLKIATGSSDADVLASVADSLDLHLETFSAIGALKGLFEILLARLRSFTEDHDSLPRAFLASLSSLAARIPEHKTVAEQLAQELARSDRKTAADACSPVSDHMAGALQIEEADFTDEIEKVLASGTTMDQVILERLFQRIIARLEESWGKSTEQQRSCGLLLTRLRTFDVVQFDILMTAWVHRFQQMTIRPSMTEILAPLISFGCLNLKDIVTSCIPTSEEDTALDNYTNSRNAIEALALVILPSTISEVMTPEEAYRLRVKQAHMHKDYPVETLKTISRAVEQSCSLLDTNTASIIAANMALVMNSLEVQQVLQRLVVMDAKCASETLVLPLCQSSNSKVIGAVEALIDNLLLPGNRNILEGTVQTEIVLGLANDLNLPFCQLKLASMLKKDEPGSVDIDGSGSSRLAVFEHAVEAAVSEGNTTWASIVPLLDISIALHLRSQAETQFLALFPSPKSAAIYDMANSRTSITQAENLLYIIDVTAYSGPPSGTTLAAEIISTFNNTWILLSHSQYSDLKHEVVTSWLPLLISFATLHNSIFEPSKAGQEFRAKALIALAGLLLELATLDTTTGIISRLSQEVFDLALILVDSLPDEVRQHCARGLRETSSNPQLSYLFSFATNPSDWLILSQREKGSGSIGHGSLPVSSTGIGETRTLEKERSAPFPLRRWEMLGVGSGLGCENDTSLSLTLFGARRS